VRVIANPSGRGTVAVCGLCTFLVGFGGSVLLVALPAIAGEFDAEVGTLSRLGATLAVGSALALPLSVLADRGRRGVMAAAGIAGFSLAALGSAAARGLEQLAVARLGAVCFETLVASVALAAAVEAAGPARRGRTTAALSFSAGAGAAVTVLTYPLLAPNWRVLYLAAAGLGLVLAPLGLRLPRQAHAEAPDIAVLLRRPWRSSLLVLGLSAALAGVFYEPANFFAVLFGSSRLGLSPAALSAVLVASGLAAACGYLGGGQLTDRAGRRLPAVGLLVLSICLAAASYVPSPALYLAAGVVASATAGAAAPVLAAWTAELVPARARVTAYTAVGVAGAIGGVAGLQLVGWLSPGLGLAAAVWLTALPALLGAALLGGLPETRGRPLPV
jgi:MFS family permease